MADKSSFRPFLFPALFLLVGGWGGLALVTHFTRPTLWPRWGFFALVVMAFTGTALPLSYLVNQRLLGKASALVTRQALWAGIYAAVLAWLEIGRVLSFSVALWLLLGVMGTEYLTQLRERLANRASRAETPDDEPARSGAK